MNGTANGTAYNDFGSHVADGYSWVQMQLQRSRERRIALFGGQATEPKLLSSASRVQKDCAEDFVPTPTDSEPSPEFTPVSTPASASGLSLSAVMRARKNWKAARTKFSLAATMIARNEERAQASVRKSREEGEWSASGFLNEHGLHELVADARAEVLAVLVVRHHPVAQQRRQLLHRAWHRRRPLQPRVLRERRGDAPLRLGGLLLELLLDHRRLLSDLLLLPLLGRILRVALPVRLSPRRRVVRGGR